MTQRLVSGRFGPTSARLLALLVALVVASVVMPAPAALAAPFQYNTYQSMVSELNALESTYPGLVEVFTAQEMGWVADPDLDGTTELEHWVVRLTNESTGFGKPEVALVGTQHGDEAVSLEVLLALADVLTSNYGTHPWLTELLDRREVYLMPLLNPWGHSQVPQRRNSPNVSGGSEDMNRDHPYDRCMGGGCFGDQVTLSTRGALALHELSRRHLFRVLLDYHGGVELILHPWGSPLHNSPNDISPDDTALATLGGRMSVYGGPYSGFTPVFTANDGLGPVNGPLDDSSYATSWDAANADPAYPTEGWRSLSYTIEISSQKKPPASTLGGDADLLTPGGSEDGYVPKHVRIGLAAIDIAEPYVVWTNRAAVPGVVLPGESFSLEWQVRGCFDVDETRVRWGTDPDPATSFDGETPTQSQTTGEPCFEPPALWSDTLSFAKEGEYWVAPTARVDQALLQQNNPNPNVAPQSFVVRSRTEVGPLFSESVDGSEINTVVGRLDWSAEPKLVRVVASLLFADGFESGDTTSWSESVP